MNGVLDDYRWLVSREAALWLDEASRDERSTVALASRLRKSLGPERSRLVLQQVELRGRARAKFSQADRMFFTSVGLEQATDEIVASYKASRFPPGASAADLCCGIGGDLLSLAARGQAVGVEWNPAMALLAEANLEIVGQGNSARVQAEDVAAFSPARFAAWHVDPDRRPEGRRTTHVELHAPGLPVLHRLLAECPHAAVKLAPASDLPEGWASEAELEWISRGRECRQLVAWFGNLAKASGRRRATVLETKAAEGRPRSLVGVADRPIAVASRLGRYLFEPDAAVLAAHLTGELAAEHGLEALAPGIAYLTADVPRSEPALACFEVTDSLPFDLKRLKELLRQRRIGKLEIKKRGIREDPALLRRRLGISGDGTAVLILAPIGRSVTAILARRIVDEP